MRIVCVVGLHSMYRSIINYLRIRKRRCKFNQWIIVFIVYLAFISQGKSMDTPNTRKILKGNVNRKNYKNNLEVLNKNATDNEDDYYLGYSGYLRSSSSILSFQSKYQNSNTNKSHKNELLPKVNGHERYKRGVTHLYNMIICATGCNPLSYKGYGCYCGFLGSGYPMDGIDRCCKMHDWCYNASECPMFVEYFVPYYWKCYRGYKPICAIEHGEWGGSGSCAQRLCECDRAFSECLRRYRCPRHKAVCTSSPWRLIQNLFMII